LGNSAFVSCHNLSSVTLSNNLTTIPSNTFTETAITSVVIPEGVTAIGFRAFADCDDLSQITLPATLAIIEGNVFYECNALAHVYYAGSEAMWTTIDIHSTNGSYLDKVTMHYGGNTDVVIASGTYGDNIRWELIGAGKLTLSGSGPMEEIVQSLNEFPWHEYNDYVTEVRRK
ncbi:MAG: leucine-rich repeat domain-containing protein, partial [Clostridia bacterium]|nr:leucine-rich repeat domain-containing protein [Clostridia bacterium]